MTQLCTDQDVLKEIPGYKAILKSVLKSQIQLLIEQLSEHTGEESIILTASVHDGSLSHLGSGTGKGFLEGREEIKSQFLGYCLKAHHKQKTNEARTPYQRIYPGHRKVLQQPIKCPKFHSGTIQTLSPGESTKHLIESNVPSSSQDLNNSGFSVLSDSNVNVKSELQEQSVEASCSDITASISEKGQTFSETSPANIPYSVHLTRTQTSSSETVNNDQLDRNLEARELELGSDSVIVKTEPNIDEGDDLEITGVEIGSVSTGGWIHGQMGYSSEGDSSMTLADQTGYSYAENQCTEPTDACSEKSTQHSPLKEGVQILEHLEFINGVMSVLFTCGQCGKQYRNKGSVYRHYRDHSVTSRYHCQLCNKGFNRNDKLKDHYLIHSGEKPYPCTLCEAKFRRLQHLRSHCITKHACR